MLNLLREITDPLTGRFGLCVIDLKSGGEIGINADEPLPMASTCKVPILVEAFRRVDAGGLNLGQRIQFTESCRCLGSGLFNHFEAGLNPTIHDLLLMMIVVSDNAATDLIVDRLGPESVSAAMRDLGLSSIRVDRTIRGILAGIITALDPRLEGVKFGEWDERCEQNPGLKEKTENLDENRRAVNEAAADRDVSSAADMARLCSQIALGKCASQESCDSMIEILDKQHLNTRLPRDLPAFTKFPHKTGTLGSGAVVNDAGILYMKHEPLAAIAFLSRDLRNPIHETSGIMAAVGRAVYDHYNL